MLDSPGSQVTYAQVYGQSSSCFDSSINERHSLHVARKRRRKWAEATWRQRRGHWDGSHLNQVLFKRIHLLERVNIAMVAAFDCGGRLLTVKYMNCCLNQK